jgi:hypothetical protein
MYLAITEVMAVLFLSNCQRWDYICKSMKWQEFGKINRRKINRRKSLKRSVEEVKCTENI